MGERGLMEKIIELEGEEFSIGELSQKVVRNVDEKRQQLAAQDNNPPAIASMTPMDMLNRAVAQGAGIDVLEKLMGLQERWEANQARMAFDKAIALAKADIRPVVKNAVGHNNKTYASFDAYDRAVAPILSKYGLSYRFKTTQTNTINVTCVISHEDGHSEETTLSGPADTTGNKNAIQAIGSTLSYLQRYSLIAALGLSASNDDDGKAAGLGQTISDEQVVALRDLIMSVDADEKKFLAYLKVGALSDIPAKRFDDCVTLLQRAKRTA